MRDILQQDLIFFRYYHNVSASSSTCIIVYLSIRPASDEHARADSSGRVCIYVVVRN